MFEQNDAYLAILKEELVAAQGCTEPIAIAFAAAKAREVLGAFPDRIIVQCSGNIIKNAKSVVVPNTGNLVGIEASALAGVVGGNSSRGLQVLTDITSGQISQITALMGTGLCLIEIMQTCAALHIVVRVQCAQENALVEIMHEHTNITRIEKNGCVLLDKNCDKADYNASLSDRSILSVRAIYDFANQVEMDAIKDMLNRQVAYNLAIAHEGLTGQYGVNIGRMLLECYGNTIYTKIRAYAAAGSDARMNGCNLPVITNSGSGNQGITASLPVVIYAQEKGIAIEPMYRALVLANLITIHQKTLLGRLSAFCGVVCAACGSGAGITFLAGGTLEQVDKTITNTLANISGIICDGAKASCAAKIASCIDAAIIAHCLAMRDVCFESDTGIVKESVESTIAAACRLGRDGMRETDVEILKIMMNT